MDTQKDILSMLEMTTNPAFAVADGCIAHLNREARQLFLQQGTPIEKLLPAGMEEYAQLTDGRLHLMLTVFETEYCAAVRRVGQYDFFILEPDADQERTRMMSLISTEMRLPLSDILTEVDQLFPMLAEMEDPDVTAKVARINRSLNQLHRLAGNLSAAFQYSSDQPPRMSHRDICAVLREMLAHIKTVAADGGHILQYSVPCEQIYCLFNEERLERAVFNMISNAMKFSAPGETVTVTVTRRGKKLYLSVEDSGCGIPSDILGTVHARYRRQPGIEEGRSGLGVGMLLLRTAAAAHGGTVLIDCPGGHGTRVTMTVAIRSERDPEVHDAPIGIDHIGGRDRALVELSDVLPSEAYRPFKK